MTTVRKLVLELGIIGDDIAKQRITEFQNSANALKQTLIEVEKQIEVLGKANVPIGSIAGLTPSVSSVLTTQEKEAMEKQTKILEAQTQAAKDREDKQLSLQEKLIQTMQDQAAGQVQLIKDITSEMKVDRQFFINITKEMAGIIDAALGYIRKEERPLGAQGPTPHEHLRDPENRMKWIENPKYAEFMKPLTDLIDRMEEALQNLSTMPAELQQEITDDLRRIPEKLKQLGEPVKEHVKKLNEIIESTQTEIVKGYIGVSPEQEARNLRESVKAFPRAAVKEVKAVKQSAEVGPRTAMPRPQPVSRIDHDIAKLENEINQLKQESTQKIQSTPQVVKPQPEDDLTRITRELKEVEDRDKLKEIYEQARKDVFARRGISERRLDVGREFEQEKERADITKEVTEMRAEMEEQWQHEQDIKKRGFAWQPEERMRELSKKAQKWTKRQEEELPARIGSWFAGTKAGRKLGFKPAEEFLLQKRSKREVEAGNIELEIERQYEKQKSAVNITINNPTIDNEERKEQLIRDITNALRGI